MTLLFSRSIMKKVAFSQFSLTKRPHCLHEGFLAGWTFTHNVKKAKITHYNYYLKDNTSNIRNTWRRLNFTLGNQSKTTTINKIEFQSLTYESTQDISGILNKHFSAIGPTLAAEIADTPIKCTDYIKPAKATFSLKQTTCAEIFSLINKLPLNKVSGLDNISMCLLKEAAPTITSPLTLIINLSIVTGSVPGERKHAWVSPVIKDGVKADPNNYRPISVLPVFSKLIERVVLNQLYGYLNENNLLTESQSGFRPRFSTETTLLEETNE